jgi:hypothetical protein
MKIALCGSSRFEKKYHEVNRRLTLAGHVVYSLSCYPSQMGDDHTTDEKEVLDLIHLAKIEESDAIFVIDCAGPGQEPYIGDSTRREMRWAALRSKMIYRLSNDGSITHLTMDAHRGMSRAEFARGFSESVTKDDWKSR